MPYSDKDKWKYGKTRREIIKIILREKIRKLMSNRINLLVLILLIALPIMFISNMLPMLTQQQTTHAYDSQLRINCNDKDFYIPYFTYCEQIGVRPSQYAK